MANLLSVENDSKQINEMLFKLFQSTRLNILLGSGASMPAISVAGDLEQEVQALFDCNDDDGATKKLYEFLTYINTCTSQLVEKSSNPNNERVQSSYKELFRKIEQILNERRTNILAKQVNIFTTNYDLFIEDAIEALDSLTLNDGFNRKPSLSGKFKFSTNSFFNAIFNNGNLYNYKVELPSVNLYKLHGSMSWSHSKDDIIYEISNPIPVPPSPTTDNLVAYINSHALILPRKNKFEETVLQHVYYDLLRLYANELDKENTTLLVFGFSFADEHILEITKRALTNPTLKIIIFAFNNVSQDGFSTQFEAYHNVDVISTGNEDALDFNKFNEIISCVLPESIADE